MQKCFLANFDFISNYIIHAAACGLPHMPQICFSKLSNSPRRSSESSQMKTVLRRKSISRATLV